MLNYDRQMKGEDLEGLDLKELNKLEAIIESRLAAVVKTKVGIIVGILINTQLVSCYHQFVYFLVSMCSTFRANRC